MFTYILATLLIAWTAIVDGSSGEDCGNEDACDSLLEQHPFQLMRSLEQLYLDEDLLQHLGDSRNPYKCYNRGKIRGPSPLCCNPIFWSSDDENWMVSLVSRENNEEKPNAELVFRLVLLDKRGGGKPKGIRSRYFSEEELKAEFQKQVIHAYAVAPEKIRRRKHNMQRIVSAHRCTKRRSKERGLGSKAGS